MHNFVASLVVILTQISFDYVQTKNLWSSSHQPIGPVNVKQTKKHGDKWYKVIDHNVETNDCCSVLDDENELTDDEEDLNNNVNNQSLSSNYKSSETASASHSNCVRDFFDCLRFRRNYKRNRKKYGKGQSRFSRKIPLILERH